MKSPWKPTKLAPFVVVLSMSDEDTCMRTTPDGEAAIGATGRETVIGSAGQVSVAVAVGVGEGVTGTVAVAVAVAVAVGVDVTVDVGVDVDVGVAVGVGVVVPIGVIMSARISAWLSGRL